MADTGAMDALVREILEGVESNPLVEGPAALSGFADRTRRIAWVALVVAVSLAGAGYTIGRHRGITVAFNPMGFVLGFYLLLGGYVAGLLPILENIPQLDNLPRDRHGQRLVDLWTSGLRLSDIAQAGVRLLSGWRLAYWWMPLPAIVGTLTPLGCMVALEYQKPSRIWGFLCFHLLLVVLSWTALLARRRGVCIWLGLNAAEGITRGVELMSRGDIGRLRGERRAGILVGLATAGPLLPLLELVLLILLNPGFSPPWFHIPANAALLGIPAYLALTPRFSAKCPRTRWERLRTEWNPRFYAAMRRMLGDPE